MIAFIGIDQYIQTTGWIEMVADVAGHCEAVKVCIKGKAASKGWVSPGVATDRARRNMRVKAKPWTYGLPQATPETILLWQREDLWLCAVGASQVFGRVLSQMRDG
ncbi:hypothetical protein [uncultured Cohaesibacter sp.]|uniref:hypothetical protein n=1 Tax=uncultured Cohaesibacter sp. TaxID=1002546 RepID=UPI002AA8C59D|nr:hypothetical protein [uncultured Cohaesibacter sp.]